MKIKNSIRIFIMPAVVFSLLLVMFSVSANGTEKAAPVPDSIALQIKDNSFTAVASGENSGTGFVTVALYDGKDLNRLLDVKVFDLATQTPTGIFTQSCYVKAMWWTDLCSTVPLCEAIL